MKGNCGLHKEKTPERGCHFQNIVRKGKKEAEEVSQLDHENHKGPGLEETHTHAHKHFRSSTGSSSLTAEETGRSTVRSRKFKLILQPSCASSHFFPNV